MVILQVMYKTSKEVMVVELRIGKGKASGIFCSSENSNHLVKLTNHL